MHGGTPIATIGTAALVCAAAAPLWASELADRAAQGFADTCFNSHLTGEMAQARLAEPRVRVEFYDLQPFSAPALSPVMGRPATSGTDRRCEVAFDGDFGALAADRAVAGLNAERIRTDVPLPTTHTDAQLPGTSLLAARALNHKRIAVVHTGTRPGPHGTETFLLVERLTPEASADQN